MALWRLAVALGFVMLITSIANADEIVRTTDGRAILLRSDGTYSEVSGIGPAGLSAAIATATTYAGDKATILACLEKEPDGSEQMRSYFDDDEEKTRVLWLEAGGSEEEWSHVQGALKKTANVVPSDCKAVLDGWARLERFSWPLSHRSPFKEMQR